MPREDADARLLSLVRDELASPAALVELQRAVAAASSSRRREKAQENQRLAGRVDELNREISNLVQSIASMGGSPALQQRLQAAGIVEEQQQAA
ncbi:MAG: hypothetical protein IPJ61_18440 [Tessaracoccus sp.]|uniref:hypothetical protein n=1 Tax=Tessaracoccus sp. TaxID=1971211 RepID=UPI001ED0EF34|nr:hypothetical protein [Tessaracoccus sp.]MBK7822964.1 hypothetical protein [Tessaracoccus sp.]